MNIAGNAVAATVAAALLAAWAPQPARTIRLADSFPGARRGSLASVLPAILANRAPGATSDDTIDLDGAIPPYDALASVSLACADPSVMVLWCGFQGSLVSARIAGGVPGTTYAYQLSWVTLSGAADTRTITQYVSLGPASAATLDTGSAAQISAALQGYLNAAVATLSTALAGETQRATDAEQALQTSSAAGVMAALTSSLEVTLTGQTSFAPFLLTQALTVIVAGTGVCQMSANSFRFGLLNLTSGPISILPPPGLSWPGGAANQPISCDPGAEVMMTALPSGRCLVSYQ